MSVRSKVLVVGPPEAGKTSLSNFLSGSTEAYSGDYYPTKGVRIMEFECLETVNGQPVRVDVELWDCGGSQEFESFWPVFSKDALGVIIVYSPGNVKHEKEIEKWHNYFIKHQKLRNSQCMLLAHHKPSSEPISEWQVPTALQNVRCTHTDLDHDPSSVRATFNSFIADLMSTLKEKQETQEIGIVTSKKRQR